MEYNKLIAEMSLSDEVEGFYVLKAAYPKTTATGKPFLSASLSDRSGSIEIKVWDYSGPISSADEGNVVKIRGTVSEFRGTPQITVDRIRLADDNDTYDLSALVPVAPIDVDTTMAEVERLISSITDADYRKICSTMITGISSIVACCLQARSCMTLPKRRSLPFLSSASSRSIR